jgi:AraC-like DNA-binding protein
LTINQHNSGPFGVSSEAIADRSTLTPDPFDSKSISLSDIGYELGYANPANFTRAFRRWAGVSPRQHRQLLCQPH